MTTCAIHAHLKFGTWKEYDEHVHMFHRKRGEKIAPHKTSGRSKNQIVAEAEASWLKPHIITDEYIRRHNEIKAHEERRGHPDGCKCFDCFESGRAHG